MSVYYESLIFRKLRFRSYLHKDRADDALVKKIKTHFGPNPVLVIGDQSAPMARYHEPIRGIGMLTMLKKKNLEVYRIDEFKTSSFCATCGAALENFKKVPDPRPYQRKKMPVVICHGLLRQGLLLYLIQFCFAYLVSFRCANKKYLQLWNRDQVVVLNFRYIMDHLSNSGEIPERFSRKGAK